jgi:O-antigen/teichoic acid export membrane protein
VATYSSDAAAWAALSLAIAAIIGGRLLSRALWRHQAWNPRANSGVMGQLARHGAFSGLGAGVHYIGAYGYTYLAAAHLGIESVAVLAATRLAVSPVTLISNGMASLMLASISRWCHSHAVSKVLRRVAAFAAALTVALSLYVAVMWLTRDWIFTNILKKQFAARDVLLLLWSAIGLLIAFRDPFVYFLTARGRFGNTFSSSIFTTVGGLIATFLAIQKWGVIGAPLGVLTGELINTAFSLGWCWREVRLRTAS